jgi:hypothetical protein
VHQHQHWHWQQQQHHHGAGHRRHLLSWQQQLQVPV